MYCILKLNKFLWGQSKKIRQQLLQSSVSHDPSIINIIYFAEYIFGNHDMVPFNSLCYEIKKNYSAKTH